ncbi:putative hydrolase [Nocardia nova SH22a]|uniref:Putative hydrolase n=1 Tax=Nocardia nova SH22a TaxID=1415166 RepID=W5TM91_9NOCA|nr:alpha/beta hydrolase [Nocardia nova]AHH20259.1 putative hydrolase [Nocardia nova SH22a]
MPYFRTTDDTTLAYEVYGTGAPIVFLAGWSLDTDMWERQLPYFIEHGYRCILLDRRGHGRSDRPAEGYDLDTRADDVAELLEHLDVREAAVVAHSGGGAEAVRYLSRHGQDRVARLILVAAAVPKLSWSEDHTAGLPQAAIDASLAALRADRAKWMADRAQGYFATHLGNDVSPARIDQEVRRCLSTAPWAAMTIQRSIGASDLRPDLAEITIPVLLLHGLADQSIPIEPTSRVAVRLLKDAVLKEYPTAGHGLYVTHADEINAEIDEFISA